MTIFLPANGFETENSLSTAAMTGMKFLTQLILSWPEGASLISRIIDSMKYCLP